MIDRLNALEKVVGRNKKFIATIESIEAWDENKDLKHNATILGTTYGSARSLALRYGLGYKSQNTNVGKNKNEVKISAVSILIDNGFTFEQIGVLFGISRQAAHEYINIHRRK